MIKRILWLIDLIINSIGNPTLNLNDPRYLYILNLAIYKDNKSLPEHILSYIPKYNNYPLGYGCTYKISDQLYNNFANMRDCCS